MATQPSHVLDRRVLAFEFAPDTTAARVALVVGGALFTALSAQVVIPMWPAPITGQTLAVLLVGAGLGAGLGSLSMLVYLAMGVAGLPFFAEASSGIAYLVGPTVGYLAAFPVAAWLVGRMAERRLDRSHGSAAWVFTTGVGVILLAGSAGFVATLDHSPLEALWAQRLYLPGELLKGAIATLALPLAWRARRGD